MDDLFGYFKTIPGAIILGSVFISIAILVSSGTIKIKGASYLQSSGTGVTAAASITPTTQVPTPQPKVNISLGHFPAKGSAGAKVAVVEFGDMRCPFCKKFFDESESQLTSDYVNTGKVKFAFRQFAFLGSASTLAGNAIECANEQNKFWDYYDYLYKNQPSESDTSMYTSDKLTSVATGLGMDATSFKSCLDSSKFGQNLTSDQNEGQQAGVSATPSFIVGKLDLSGKKIINGQLIIGAVPYSTIKAAIDSSL